jgi:acyl-CoA synthetase (AMP-forming)/AMP-acid ligase II
VDERGLEIGHLTYADLDLRARAIAAGLQKISSAKDRILLLFPPGLDFVTAFFACLYAGNLPVVVYPPRRNQSMNRLSAIVADAKPAVALTTATSLTHTRELFAQLSCADTLRWLTTESICNDLADQWHDPQSTSDDIAFLQYTSGSTSEPKGVAVSHGNILHNEKMIQRAFQHDEQTVVVGWLPPYHDMGLIGNVLQPLYVGCRCILMSPVAFLLRPVRWLEAISRYRATTSGAPNFAYDMCVRKISASQRENLDLRSWKVAYNGSEPVQRETMERFAKAFGGCGFRAEAFYPCYGLAEATLFVTGGMVQEQPIAYAANADKLAENQICPVELGAGDARWLVSSGHGWEDQRIAIVDPKTLTRCADGAIGEIWVAGANVAQGYWQRPTESAAVFQAMFRDTGEGPFLRTGDLGFVLHGELFVTGRLHDLLIIRGRNYYPQDIELTVERAHPALRPGCGAAFTIDHIADPRLVVAHEVERHIGAVDSEKIAADVRQAVAVEHDLNVTMVLLLKTGTIPRTSSGKVRRSACRMGFLQETLSLVAIDDPGALAVRMRPGGAPLATDVSAVHQMS